MTLKNNIIIMSLFFCFNAVAMMDPVQHALDLSQDNNYKCIISEHTQLSSPLCSIDIEDSNALKRTISHDNGPDVLISDIVNNNNTLFINLNTPIELEKQKRAASFKRALEKKTVRALLIDSPALGRPIIIVANVDKHTPLDLVKNELNQLNEINVAKSHLLLIVQDATIEENKKVIEKLKQEIKELNTEGQVEHNLAKMKDESCLAGTLSFLMNLILAPTVLALTLYIFYQKK